MLMILAVSLLMQTEVDAGDIQVSCGGSPVTLQALVTDPPANFEIQWEDAFETGDLFVVNPIETTVYRVFLTDLDTMEVFEDSVRVLVHPGDADLTADMTLTVEDGERFLRRHWNVNSPGINIDPDQDGEATILDWFYFCDFVTNPINTPPELIVSDAVTFRNQTATIPFTVNDAEGGAQIGVSTPPMRGTALILGGSLSYVPDQDFVGNDSFVLVVSDGQFSIFQTVNVTVLQVDTWQTLFDEIFNTVSCRACHVQGSSGGINFSTYNSARQGGNSGVPGFTPGNLQASTLYLRVADGSMPLGQLPLPQDQIDRIRDWILRGAPEN